MDIMKNAEVTVSVGTFFMLLLLTWENSFVGNLQRVTE